MRTFKSQLVRFTSLLSIALLLLPTNSNADSKKKAIQIPSLAIGSDIGNPEIDLFNYTSNKLIKKFRPTNAKLKSGVRVAFGDLNGDGVSEVISVQASGALPIVRIHSTQGKLLSAFYAYDPSVTVGLFVTLGDIDGDQLPEIIVAPDTGAAPYVRVFNGRTFAEVRSFYAFDSSFTGGVRVASGDINGDGFDDIITAQGPGGDTKVSIFSGTNNFPLLSTYPFDSSFSGGVYVAAGDLDNDGQDEVIATLGSGGSPLVQIFSGYNGDAIASFYAYDTSYLGGLRVSSTDVNGDGLEDILIGTGASATPSLRIFSGNGLTLLKEILPKRQVFRYGIFPAGKY